jgi:uncharacterized membrane protein
MCPVTTYNEIAGRNVHRIAGLSDGLFAIAMTLIVFDIRLPDASSITSDQGLLEAIGELWPRFATYGLSFLTLGIFWNGQQTQLHYIDSPNRTYGWIHLVFLAMVALMPFSTSVLADHFQLRVALVVYWLNLLAMGLVLLASWRYARSAGLLGPEAGPDVSNAVERRIVSYQALYLVSMLIGLAFGTPWGVAGIVLAQLNSAIAPRIGILSRF